MKRKKQHVLFQTAIVAWILSLIGYVIGLILKWYKTKTFDEAIVRGLIIHISMASSLYMVSTLYTNSSKNKEDCIKKEDSLSYDKKKSGKIYP